MLSPLASSLQEKRIHLCAASSLCGRGDILFCGRMGSSSPSPITAKKRANHEHSLLNHTQPQERHNEISSPLNCTVVWPQAAAAHYQRPSPITCWHLLHQVTPHKLLPQLHCLTRRTLLSPHLKKKKTLRPRGKWLRRGRCYHCAHKNESFPLNHLADMPWRCL